MKVAVIGAGAMGTHHIRTYYKMKDVDLVGISDVNEAHGEKTANKYNTAFYKNYKRLIQEKKPEAISIAVPTSQHTTIALDCIDAGIAVLVEKPLAPTVKEAKKIVARAKKKNVILLAGHIERFNPVILKLHQLITDGAFGEILSITIHRVGLHPPRVQDTNVITDLAIHDLDIACSIIGRLPYSIFARGGSAYKNKYEDHAEIFLNFGTCGAYLQANWITPIKIRTLIVTGTKGYAEINYLTQKITFYKTLTDNYKTQLPIMQTIEKYEINTSGQEPLRIELENFLRSVTGDEKLYYEPKEAVRAVALSEIVTKSIREGKVINVKKI